MIFGAEAFRQPTGSHPAVPADTAIIAAAAKAALVFNIFPSCVLNRFELVHNFDLGELGLFSIDR